jgi:hypothetical protein
MQENKNFEALPNWRLRYANQPALGLGRQCIVYVLDTPK